MFFHGVFSLHDAPTLFELKTFKTGCILVDTCLLKPKCAVAVYLRGYAEESPNITGQGACRELCPRQGAAV